MTTPHPQIRGFYLHGCWAYQHPFAVRNWSLRDFEGMFELLHRLGINTAMLWPMTEALPPPLSNDDAQHLAKFRDIIDAARRAGLRSWSVFTPNITSKPEIRAKPPVDRHYYPYIDTYRADDPVRWRAYLNHLRDVLRVINHADGYVMIDGDPGGYRHAPPEHFHRLLHALRQIISAEGAAPDKQELIPWLWNGWGRPTGPGHFWAEPVEPRSRAVMQLIRDQPVSEPWTLLPGRSYSEQHGNGRTNLALTDELGMASRSVLLLYEIVEFEPIAPAFTPQFDAIRRVMKQEQQLIAQSRGVMANAQQPLTSLANLFYFTRILDDPNWLKRDDNQVLTGFCEFLGGDAGVLGPALGATLRSLADISADLPDRVRQQKLTSPVARCLPGGPEQYVEILASWVQTWRDVLLACDAPPVGTHDAARRISDALIAMHRWWSVHRYVFSGEGVLGFDLPYNHFLLVNTLRSWIERHARGEEWVNQAADRLSDQTQLPKDRALAVITPLIQPVNTPAAV